MLTAAAEGRGVADVFPTGRPAPPVEVLLVERDITDQTGVGVHAHAEHQAAGLRFVAHDLDGNIARRIFFEGAGGSDTRRKDIAGTSVTARARHGSGRRIVQ